MKILTATGNQEFNNRLKKEFEFEVLESDIFYREGILEFLEKNKKIDILILYEKLDGEINLIHLIKSIKKINYEINIFFILENRNEELEKLLKIENIKNIFYNDQINISEFIEQLKNIKINNKEKLEEEIKILKNIIDKQDEELLKYKNNNFEKLQSFESKKIIGLMGEKKVGKTLILNNLSAMIEKKNEYEFKEVNINDFWEIEKLNTNINQFIFILEINFEKIQINRKIINKLILDHKIDPQKTNIIFNKINKYSINKKIAKNIFKEFKVIGNIKLNNYCDFLLNEKHNYKNENKKLKREYLKIIKSIIKN